MEIRSVEILIQALNDAQIKPTTQEQYQNHPGWRWCTAQGSRDHVLLLGLQTTFREKLEWLERSETWFLQMQAQNVKREDL